jgi:peroxisomal coenzyme A diphosphatase NUDT7
MPSCSQLRHSSLAQLAGEVCLPGGKAEPGDADAAATALREAHEEIGLPPESVQIASIQQQPVLSKHLLSVSCCCAAGCLITWHQRATLRDKLLRCAQVTPVIGVLDAAVRSQLQASEAEVEAIFDCPLEMFLRDSPAHKHKDVWWNETIQYRWA